MLHCRHSLQRWWHSFCARMTLKPLWLWCSLAWLPALCVLCWMGKQTSAAPWTTWQQRWQLPANTPPATRLKRPPLLVTRQQITALHYCTHMRAGFWLLQQLRHHAPQLYIRHWHQEAGHIKTQLIGTYKQWRQGLTALSQPPCYMPITDLAIRVGAAPSYPLSGWITWSVEKQA